MSKYLKMWLDGVDIENCKQQFFFNTNDFHEISMSKPKLIRLLILQPDMHLPDKKSVVEHRKYLTFAS